MNKNALTQLIKSKYFCYFTSQNRNSRFYVFLYFSIYPREFKKMRIIKLIRFCETSLYIFVKSKDSIDSEVILWNGKENFDTKKSN